MTSGTTGPGSPLIAGVPSVSEFNDPFSDDEFSASTFFDLQNSPDTLQTLETLGANEHKSFISTEDLINDSFPESPNDSYESSSSDRESSKRIGSSTSEVAADAMDDHDVNMAWANGDDAQPFSLAAEDGQEFQHPPGNSIYGAFDGQEDNLTSLFDYVAASGSPGGPMSMASPEMPIIGSLQPRTSEEAILASKSRKESEATADSFSNQRIKSSGSRDVSPVSNMLMSYQGSPSALSPLPILSGAHEFAGPSGHRSGPAAWSTDVDKNPRTQLDGFPGAMQPGSAMARNWAMQQRLPLFGAAAVGLPTKYELKILPTPLKSRVETQIPVRLVITPLPPGITKLHLPTHTISKPKLLAKPTPKPSPDMLELSVTLVCTSAIESDALKRRVLERAARHPQNYLPPLLDSEDHEDSPQNGGDVRICSGCIMRERKRAARKKVKNPEEETSWCQDEERRVIVFNTAEVKEWQAIRGLEASCSSDPLALAGVMQVDAPMRIACYCRHHGEKMGFNVIFTIKDYKDRIIAQAMSNPIMITDDHKTHPQLSAQSTKSSMQGAPGPTPIPNSVPGHLAMVTDAGRAPNGNSHAAQSSLELSAMHRTSPPSALFQAAASGKTPPLAASTRTSRPASPTLGGPMAKKRKASSSKIPADLTMTRLNTSPSPGAQLGGNQHSATTSPFSSNLNSFSQSDALFGQPNGHASFSTGPPTPSNEQYLMNVNRSSSMDNMVLNQLYSAPTSSHPSRAPSPSDLRNATAAQATLASQLTGNVFGVPTSISSHNQAPIIHKIIPAEGPMSGGIEVTVLGASFYQGLEVCFGDHKATTTTFWGESSLVCLLPPSPAAGIVPVTLRTQATQAAQNFTKQPPVFKYVDDNEDQLIRAALNALGHKMSGGIMDASDLARRILHDGKGSWSGGASSGGQSSGGHGGQVYSHSSYAHLESQLLKCLDLIDLDDSVHRTRLELEGPTGLTMLHLACSLGYHRFVAALLARGANPDAQDKGGFTPLHMAGIQNHAEIVRRLMLVGADPSIKTLSGLTAADVTRSRNVHRAIRRTERHVRSRSSGGSLHSRTSSATSLRSLWEPLTKVHTHDEPLTVDSSEESPEYTSSDLEDEDSGEDDELVMRRASGFGGDRVRPKLVRQATEELEVDLASPSYMATPAALKEHFQQQLHLIQQAMAVHLPQMQIPTFPGMPVLPDYQAYFQQAPFMRRVTQMMPGMGGWRPETRDAAASELQHSWWNAFSKASSVPQAAPPPAYEDIYPQKDLDRKFASELQSAYDADAKCEASLDPTEDNSPAAETKSQTPTVLQIGRKNAITKEQQEQFLKAREEKLKRLGSDRNLFFIWIPLLLLMICTILYSYFPSLYPFAFTFVQNLCSEGFDKTQQLILQTRKQEPIPEGPQPMVAT